MRAGLLDRRIQFMRAVEEDNGLEVKQVFESHGARIWGSRKDVSDGERAVAGWIEATLASRFVIRSTGFTRGITAKDRLVCDGQSYDITGIKEIGRRLWLEITGIARADQ